MSEKNDKKLYLKAIEQKFDKPTESFNIELTDELFFSRTDLIIGNFEEAPDYLKDNEYIRTGYLINCNSFKKVFSSLIKCHNETMNVWTHLLGTLIAIILIFYTSIFISTNSGKFLNYFNYEKMTYDIKKVISPWLIDLKNDKHEEKKLYSDTIISYIETIISKSNLMLYEINNKIKNLSLYMKNYINEINNIINKIIEKIKLNSNSKIFDDITLKWEICNNKILDILKGQSNEEIINNYDNNLKRWPLFIMLAAAIVCLGCSTTFHLFGTMSKSINKVLSRIDYAGITFLVAGIWAGVYLIFISVFALSVFFFSLSSDFHVPKRRRLRGILFLSLGISTAIPILHLTFFGKYVRGFDKLPYLQYWYYGGISYVFGGVMYVLRIPERFCIGKFDIFGASHQILHIFVDLGFILHYLGAIDSFYYRVENQCPVI